MPLLTWCYRILLKNVFAIRFESQSQLLLRISDGWVSVCEWTHTTQWETSAASRKTSLKPDTSGKSLTGELAPDRWGREKVRKGYNSLSLLLAAYRSSPPQPRYGTMFVIWQKKWKVPVFPQDEILEPQTTKTKEWLCKALYTTSILGCYPLN